MVVKWKLDTMGHWDLFLNGDIHGYITNPEFPGEKFKWRAVKTVEHHTIVPAPTLDEAKLIIQTMVLLEG